MPRDIGNGIQVSPGISFPTYSLTANDIVPVTSCFDIFNLANPAATSTNAGVVCVITRLVVSLDATAASTMDMYLVRRSAANTGGTSVAIPFNPAGSTATSALSGTVAFTSRDTADPVSAVTVTAYSANPTYGAGLTIDVGRLTVPAIATPAVPVYATDLTWANRGAKPPVIRPGQFFAPSFGGQTTPAGAGMYLALEWVEIPAGSYF